VRAGRLPTLRRYTRVCFDKAHVRLPGKPTAELIAPGHPLLDAVIDLVAERHRHLLTQGAVLVDVTGPGDAPALLAFLEHSITDGTTDRAGRARVVSRRFEFVQIAPNGEAVALHSAPYLDLQPASTAQVAAVTADLDRRGWPGADAEAVALEHAVSVSALAHLAQVRLHTTARIERTRDAVRGRLTDAINHWDQRANELAEQAAAGRQPKMNPDRARQRADELQRRLSERMALLDAEQQLNALPPRLVGAAMVAPLGYFRSLGVAEGDTVGAFERTGDTVATERAAVDAVMEAEWSIGRRPTEMHHSNPGFDIESIDPDGDVWHLEVKGRIRGATEFTVTHNEFRHGSNRPDRFVLALVEVDPDSGKALEVRYVHRPFNASADAIPFGLSAHIFKWKPYWDNGDAPAPPVKEV
jgi:hypothetical protein